MAAAIGSGPQVGFSGFATGLDTQGIIDALTQVKRTPILRLQAANQKLQNQSSAFANLQAKLDALRTQATALDQVSLFGVAKPNSTNTNVATVAADGTATEGTYSLTVNALAVAENVISTGVSAATGVNVGSGQITLSSGGQNYTVDAGTGADLTQLRDAVNSSGAPVNATIINDGVGANPYRLLLTAKSTGTAATFTVDTSAYTAAAGFSASLLTAPGDASITVNGVTLQRGSNTIGDAISGVTFNLTGLGTSTATVTHDTDAITAKVQKLVDSFNDVLDALTAQDNFANRDTTAPLYGDSGTLRIGSNLRSVISQDVTGTGSVYNSLASVGITSGASGRLAIDATKFGAALAQDFNGVAALFTKSTSGVANAAIQTATDNIQAILDRTTSIASQQHANDVRINALETAVAQYTDDLRTKYANLEVVVGQLQTQGNSLASLSAPGA